jgi:hypothetical protein
MFAKGKHSSLFDPFISNKENEVLQKRPLAIFLAYKMTRDNYIFLSKRISLVRNSAKRVA